MGVPDPYTDYHSGKQRGTLSVRSGKTRLYVASLLSCGSTKCIKSGNTTCQQRKTRPYWGDMVRRRPGQCSTWNISRVLLAFGYCESAATPVSVGHRPHTSSDRYTSCFISLTFRGKRCSTWNFPKPGFRFSLGTLLWKAAAGFRATLNISNVTTCFAGCTKIRHCNRLLVRPILRISLGSPYK